MTSRHRKISAIAAACVVAIIGIAAFYSSRKHAADEATALLKVGDYVRAVSNLKIAAYMGDSNAQALLGDMYALGWGVTEDDGEAISWYRRAGIEREDTMDPSAPAMFYIGRKYLGGEGLPRNEVEARKWFQRSARGGYAKAAAALAQITPKVR